MSDHLLPPAFAELEPFIDWSLATESERLQKRLDSSMDEIRAFYSAMLGRIEEMLEYLNGFPLDQLNEPEQRINEYDPVFSGDLGCRGIIQSTGPPLRLRYAPICSRRGDLRMISWP